MPDGTARGDRRVRSRTWPRLIAVSSMAPPGLGREIEADLRYARRDPKVGELEAQRPAAVDQGLGGVGSVSGDGGGGELGHGATPVRSRRTVPRMVSSIRWSIPTKTVSTPPQRWRRQSVPHVGPRGTELGPVGNAPDVGEVLDANGVSASRSYVIAMPP